MASHLVHLIRHGRVASHRGDVPIVTEARREIEAAGLRLAESIEADEVIHVLTTPTARSRESAATLRSALERSLPLLRGEGEPDRVRLLEPRSEWAIRNPDLFLAGRRVEMVSTPEATCAQIPDSGVTAEAVDRVPFFHAFFRSPDRIGFWLGHPDPPGENAAAVARRVLAYTTSLRDAPTERPQRFLCVTHSPVMRAVLIHFLGFDPGEPEWVERIDVAVDLEGVTIGFRDRARRLQSEALV